MAKKMTKIDVDYSAVLDCVLVPKALLPIGKVGGGNGEYRSLASISRLCDRAERKTALENEAIRHEQNRQANLTEYDRQENADILGELSALNVNENTLAIAQIEFAKMIGIEFDE